ncbi:hypothetical protein MNBD_DELTA01-1411 [hydrothermal vent metagenome]|uniref:Response regulator n=1 Tax=hydrothermal vent metagenome TaxID=652676 RepID=A0A3B0R6I4_9ZZZZ
MRENGEGHTILFVDDEENILKSLSRLFRRADDHVMTATSGKEALELFLDNDITLVVSDYRMPEMDGVEFLSKVKELSPNTVRFMLTGYADKAATIAAINSGEVARYVTKPWNDEELKAMIGEAMDHHDLRMENKRLDLLTRKQNAELTELNHGLEEKVRDKTKKIRENFFAFVRIFANMMEFYDPYKSHSKRVAVLAKEIAIKMALDESEVELIESAALLHNIGLIGIPREILDKEDSELEKYERVLVRQSPLLSQELLSSIDTLRQAGVIIRSHMERSDGSGYPDGLKGEEIPLGARIIAVADQYDTLVKRRTEPLSRKEATEWLSAKHAAGFDPDVVRCFDSFIFSWKDEQASIAVPVADIKAGVVLAKDVYTAKGRLLVPKETRLTDVMVERIRNFNTIDPVVERVQIMA